jgi:hypothetical protein
MWASGQIQGPATLPPGKALHGSHYWEEQGLLPQPGIKLLTICTTAQPNTTRFVTQNNASEWWYHKTHEIGKPGQQLLYIQGWIK